MSAGFHHSNGDPLLKSGAYHTSLTLTMSGAALKKFFEERIAKATARKTQALAAVETFNAKARADNAAIMRKGRENIEKRKHEPSDPAENTPEYKKAYEGAVEMIEAEYGPEGTEAACKRRVARVEEYFEREIEVMRLLADHSAEDEVSYLEPDVLIPYYEAERMDLESNLGGLHGHRLARAPRWDRSASLGEMLGGRVEGREMSESRMVDSMVKTAGPRP